MGGDKHGRMSMEVSGRAAPTLFPCGVLDLLSLGQPILIWAPIVAAHRWKQNHWIST
jgi:hypothetical protein